VTNIISTISGYFSKSLIMGILLPVMVFVILSLIFLVPILPAELQFLKPLEALDTQWKVLAVTLLIIVLTGLLYNLNVPLIRLYEGYPWRDLWIGKRRTKRHVSRYRSLLAQWKGLPELEEVLRGIVKANKLPSDERIEELHVQLVDAGQRLNTDFPDGEKWVLPTRLGNTIRSFETYPNSQYGIESITVWPRLIAEINKDYAAIIDDAKTSFDFMLNCSALSATLSLLIFAAGLANPLPFASWPSLILWLFEIIIFGLLAYPLYILAIGRAGAWGEMVKGAFDLYRGELLKKLGFNQAPATQEEERRLWRTISNRMIFNEYYQTPPATYAAASTFATGEDDTIRLEVGRGIGPPASNGQIPVTLQIRNVGDFSAESVVVTDSLPEGFHYQWGTALVVDPHAIAAAGAPARQVTVSGANPYRFAVGQLKRKKELTLIYYALPFKKSE
jgi:uncharacterized repeat protein (TIGR01451 family)